MPAKRKLSMLSPDGKGKGKSSNKRQEREETPVEAVVGDETKHGVILRSYYPREISDARAQSYADGVLETPLSQLVAAMARCKDSTAGTGGGYKCVVHWFRGDLRLGDNAALSLASARARQAGAPLVGLYVLSPQDLEAHVVSPAKVDFALRSLRVVKRDLEALGIPLHVEVVRDRGHVEERVLELCREWGAGGLFANMEYEVDELRRDEKIVKMGAQRGVQFTVVHDLCVVPPGELVSKTKGKPFAVYTPWFKAWIEHTHAHPDCLELAPPLTKNPNSARKAYSSLFSSMIPPVPASKALDSPEQAEYLEGLYPAGEHAAQARLAKFIQERVTKYADDRNALGESGTSMLSVHFASGTLSARQAVSAVRAANSTTSLNGGCKGIQTWISEVAWRDFYKHVLASWPYVCMSKPFKIPYSQIPWPQTPESDSHFQAWTTGHTGYPIIDAAMRQLTTTKYMHNRTRMVVASFLTKDLLIDWRRGEQFFMSHLVDGDFASNNGGWGWAAGTGVDPQPYFRVFNPLLQSEKFDPEGTYIRTWVPELRCVQGAAVHAPHARLDKRAFEKLGYPPPIVDHAVARKRSIEVYKAAARP